MRRYKHIMIPVGLVLMALATRYLLFHDSGTVRGMVILCVDGLKWLTEHVSAVLIALGIPRAGPVPVAGHVCPYDVDPFIGFPADAFALGVILVKSTVIYGMELQRLWTQRKPTPPPFQEL